MRSDSCRAIFLLVTTTAVQSQVRKCRARLQSRPAEGFTTSPRPLPVGRRGLLVRSDPVSANGALVLMVVRMHGTLPREAMRQEDVPRIPRS